jgi:hypothetical protein
MKIGKCLAEEPVNRNNRQGFLEPASSLELLFDAALDAIVDMKPQWPLPEGLKCCTGPAEVSRSGRAFPISHRRRKLVPSGSRRSKPGNSA